MFRMVQPPRRRGLFRVDSSEYEVSAGPGDIRRVTLLELPEALGVKLKNSHRDWQECEMAASHLYREGRSEWVLYPTTEIMDNPASLW